MKNNIFYANAKVSIYMNVIGKTNDRWRLESFILPINIYDKISIELNDDNIVQVLYNSEDHIDMVSTEIYTAIMDIKKIANIKKGVFVKIEKGIPISSGLGGESSDIITILRALNILLGADLTIKQFLDLSKRYGRDAFFFAWNKPAFVISEEIYGLPNFVNCNFECFIIDPNIKILEKKTQKIMNRKIHIDNKKMDKILWLNMISENDIINLNKSMYNFIDERLVPEYKQAFNIAAEIERLLNFRPCFTGTGSFLVILVDNSIKTKLIDYCTNMNLKYYITNIISGE